MSRSASGTLSVRETGARGDGITDDASAIQRALDSAEPIVAIPEGVYSLGDTLRIGSGKTLLAHPRSVLRLADGAGRNVSSFLLTNADHASGNDRIEVNGGIWDGNNQGNHRGPDGDPDAYTGVALNFVKVRHLRLADLTIRNPDSFSIRIGDTRYFTIENVCFDHPVSRPNQDGVHVGGYCENGCIRDLRALTPDTTNDDMVALNADDDVERALNLGMKRGPIRNIHVEGLAGDSVYTFVRLLSETHRIENILIRGIRGACRWHVINMHNWRFPIGCGDIRNVEIKDVKVTKAERPNDAALVVIRLRVKDLVIEDLERPEDGSGAPTLVVDNHGRNSIALRCALPHELQTVSPGGETTRPSTQPLILPDRTVVGHLAMKMRRGGRLVLARGGIGRLEVNRENPGETHDIRSPA